MFFILKIIKIPVLSSQTDCSFTFIANEQDNPATPVTFSEEKVTKKTFHIWPVGFSAGFYLSAINARLKRAFLLLISYINFSVMNKSHNLSWISD